MSYSSVSCRSRDLSSNFLAEIPCNIFPTVKDFKWHNSARLVDRINSISGLELYDVENLYTAGEYRSHIKVKN